MTTFAVTYTYDDRAEARDLARPEHRSFLRGLLDAGALLASGPLSSTQRHGSDAERAVPPGALLLVRAEDPDEAMALLRDDPFQVGRLVADVVVRAWDPVIGPWATSSG